MFRETGIADGIAADSPAQPLVADIGQAVSADTAADFLCAPGTADQLVIGRGIDAIKTGGNHLGAGNAHVNFARPCTAHHGDNLPACRSTHDTVIDKGNALAFNQGVNR